MTIKEFARLCGCNPQTLRYYDHVDLLKPVKVDPWSGYRFYEEDQALSFVKIKNLQKAGFRIEEIKELLDKENSVIYKAFDAKIAEAKTRLQEIEAIQKSYLTEMNDIQEKIREESIRAFPELLKHQENINIHAVLLQKQFPDLIIPQRPGFFNVSAL